MLMPKRVKYRKAHRGRLKGKSKGATTVDFGQYGLQALESHWITSRQIESARVALTRYIKKGGKLWIRIFPDKPVSKKPAETRMGKGKGDLDHWVAVVKRGKIVFELGGVPEEYARQCFRLAVYKLPLKTKFVTRTQR